MKIKIKFLYKASRIALLKYLLLKNQDFDENIINFIFSIKKTRRVQQNNLYQNNNKECSKIISIYLLKKHF